MTPTKIAKNLAVAGAVTLGAELAAAVLWPAPAQPEHDPSATVGAGTRRLRVAVLGDSTVTSPGVGDPDRIWVREVARRLASAAGATVELRSYAVGGSTARDVVVDQLDGAVRFGPDLALVSVGANDVIKGVPLRRFAEHLDTVVDRLSSVAETVVTSGVGDLGAIPRLAPPLRELVARRGLRADQIHTDVTVAYGALKVDQWAWASTEFRTRRDVWSRDHFHPNEKGHEIWADVCWETVGPLYGGGHLRL